MLKPLSGDRWNFTTAAHLLNRAGFGGTPAEIEKLVRLGPEKAVSHLVDFENIPDDNGLTLIGTITVTTVPEPSTLSLLGVGSALLAGWHKRRRRNQPMI